ncbi:MAG: CoA ester lyase [Pseudomonadota bacterium]
MISRPRRSALYMPGSNARALEKAKSLAADTLLLDLEDSVAPDAKAMAGDQVATALADGGYGGREIAVRINGVDSTWFADDISMIAQAKPDGVLIPKAESAADISSVRAALTSAGAAPGTQLWAMIETPRAILNVAEIAAAAQHDRAYPLVCFVIGPNDLVKETRAVLDRDRTAALYWLSATITAARAFGIDVLDGVYNAHKDLDGFAYECRHGRSLGMDGKSLIHPGQIDIANRVFAPTDEDVAWARKVIAAFEDPTNAGKGVISLDGTMVELLHLEMARRTAAVAGAIAEREANT